MMGRGKNEVIGEGEVRVGGTRGVKLQQDHLIYGTPHLPSALMDSDLTVSTTFVD